VGKGKTPEVQIFEVTIMRGRGVIYPSGKPAPGEFARPTIQKNLKEILDSLDRITSGDPAEREGFGHTIFISPDLNQVQIQTDSGVAIIHVPLSMLRDPQSAGWLNVPGLLENQLLYESARFFAGKSHARGLLKNPWTDIKNAWTHSAKALEGAAGHAGKDLNTVSKAKGAFADAARFLDGSVSRGANLYSAGTTSLEISAALADNNTGKAIAVVPIGIADLVLCLAGAPGAVYSDGLRDVYRRGVGHVFGEGAMPDPAAIAEIGQIAGSLAGGAPGLKEELRLAKQELRMERQQAQLGWTGPAPD
jgi:hypothetical protein